MGSQSDGSRKKGSHWKNAEPSDVCLSHSYGAAVLGTIHAFNILISMSFLGNFEFLFLMKWQSFSCFFF